jgi:DNA repair photolyase
MESFPEYIKGRGAQLNPANPFFKNSYHTSAPEGLDEAATPAEKTTYYVEHSRKIVNRVDSPDIGMGYSLNPYQGCEHGCIYCYARNAHTYWGFSAGLDFEQKIIIKKEAPQQLEKHLQNPKWVPSPIILSGNTDCYQPVEQELELTRQILELMLKYRHPIGLITKNRLILRDIDILSALARQGLVHVSISLTTLDEKLRRMMEPRTAAVQTRLEVIRRLSGKGIPVNVMTAPIIPGLNSHEIPNLIKESAKCGALSAGYTLIRLNGAVSDLFVDWLQKNFPSRAEKVLSQIRECHGGSLSDSQFGRRIHGEGRIAESIRQLFHLAKNQFLQGKSLPPYNLTAFRRPGDVQLSLF